MNYGKDFTRLTPKFQAFVVQVVARCQSSGVRESLEPDPRTEVYAYPNPGGGIAWGVNGEPYGFCLARDIATKD